MERRSYSIDEICERNGISRSTIYAEIRRGKLRVRKLGVRSLVTDEDERAWLDGMPVITGVRIPIRSIRPVRKSVHKRGQTLGEHLRTLEHAKGIREDD
jgi:excisionase family DNA binding protein